MSALTANQRSLCNRIVIDVVASTAFHHFDDVWKEAPQRTFILVSPLKIPSAVCFVDAMLANFILDSIPVFFKMFHDFSPLIVSATIVYRFGLPFLRFAFQTPLVEGPSELVIVE